MARKIRKPDEQDLYRLDAQLLSDLWIFRLVARAGSVTAAADRLRVTQGAISQRIIRLEGRLGTALFSRKSGRLTLNELGSGLLATMNDVAVRLGATLSRFDHARRLSLVVSCIPSLATEWLIPRLDEFYRNNPDIELFIRAEITSATAERMEDEGIDLLIGYQETSPPDLQELVSLREMIVPVCTRAYRDDMERQDGPPSITRLHDDVPWLGGPRHFEWSTWEEANPAWSCVVVAERHFNLAHLAYHAALCGHGVAMGRAVQVSRLLNRGELISAADVAPVASATYRVFARRPGDSRSPVRKFASWIVGAMEETQRDTLALLAKRPA